MFLLFDDGKEIIVLIAFAACALAVQFVPAAPPPEVKEVVSKSLTDIPGKKSLALTVTSVLPICALLARGFARVERRALRYHGR